MDGMKRRALFALPLVLLLVLAGCPNPLLDTVKGIIALANATSVFTVSVDGAAIAADGTVSFGSVVVDETASKTFTITNNGGAELALTSTPAVGEAGDTAVLEVTAQPPSSIAAGESGTFAVQFAPTAAGSWTTTLSIATNDPGIPTFSFTVTGTSVGPSILVYQATESDLPNGTGVYTFPTTQVSTSSPPVTFTIKNAGAGTLKLTSTPSILVSDEFSVGVQPASTSIAAGGSTTFTVLFNPTTAVEHTGTVTIASNAGAYTFQVKGTGSDTPVPQILVYQTTEGDLPIGSGIYAFSDTLIDTSSSAVTFHIKNTGSAPLNLTGIPYVIVTLDASFVAGLGSTTTPIASGAETTFTITFSPTTAGNHEGLVSIPSNAGTYSFHVSGLCTRPVIKVKEPGGVTDITNGGTSSASFGTPEYYVAGSPVTFTIKNEGDGNLSLTHSPYVWLTGTSPDQFSVTAQPSSPVAPGATSTFQVTFTPTSGGQKSATVNIASNDPSTPTFTYTIRGTGTGIKSLFSSSTASYVSAMTAREVGTADHVYVVYSDGNGDLSYMRSVDKGVSFPLTATIESSVDVGCVALKESGGYLYVVYYDATNKILRFAKSTSNGASWGTPITLDNLVTDTGNHCSIDVVDNGSNDYVYVSHYATAGTTGYLRFVRSDDSGATWDPVIMVNNPGSGKYAGKYTSVAGTGANVYISYQYDDGSTKRLYCDCSSDHGQTFPTRKTTTYECLSQTSIAANGSDVWIAYNDTAGHNLAYMTGGATSFSTRALDTEAGGGHPSLRLNGTDDLYLSYQTKPSMSTCKFKFTRSEDGGATWTSPVTLTTTTTFPWYTGAWSSLSYYYADSTPRLYVTWVSYRTSPTSTRLYLGRSNDSGLTW